MFKFQTYLTRTDEVGSEPYDSIEWAFEVHLKQPDTHEYHYAVLWGNEDAPTQIDFYRTEPLITDKPAMTWYSPEYNYP